MAILGTKQARIDELTGELADLQNQITIAGEKETALENSLAAEQAKVEELSGTVQELNGKIEAVEKERDEAKAETEKIKAELPAKAHEEAQRILAASGTEEKPVEGDDENPGAPTKSILERYREISDPAEKSNFYREHEAEFRAAFAR